MSSDWPILGWCWSWRERKEISSGIDATTRKRRLLNPRLPSEKTKKQKVVKMIPNITRTTLYSSQMLFHSYHITCSHCCSHFGSLAECLNTREAGLMWCRLSDKQRRATRPVSVDRKSTRSRNRPQQWRSETLVGMQPQQQRSTSVPITDFNWISRARHIVSSQYRNLNQTGLKGTAAACSSLFLSVRQRHEFQGLCSVIPLEGECCVVYIRLGAISAIKQQQQLASRLFPFPNGILWSNSGPTAYMYGFTTHFRCQSRSASRQAQSSHLSLQQQGHLHFSSKDWLSLYK